MEQERKTASQLNNNDQDEDSKALASNVNSIEVSPLLLHVTQEKSPFFNEIIQSTCWNFWRQAICYQISANQFFSYIIIFIDYKAKNYVHIVRYNR